MSTETKSFKDTLNLPRTEFPIRGNSKQDDPVLLKRWQDQDLYKKSFEHNSGKIKYILHDGPPYANGNIHLGHAYNKILKDIVCKYRRMAGYHVPLTPGWDCHGLPIELKVVANNPELADPINKNNDSALSCDKRVKFIKACRDYANNWINIQKEEFKKLGVLADWDSPYITMSPDYEASTLRAFGKLVSEGYIERKNKTVAWCASCQTTLASAEIEYQDRKDPSVYVEFELDEENKKALFANISGPISFAVWTTTPWTLPLNRGLLIHKDASYSLITIKDKNNNSKNIIIGSQVAAKFVKLLDQDLNVVEEFSPARLFGAKALHPFVKNLKVPVILDSSVGLDEGTAVVHVAPGCGPIDYEIGVKNGLEIYCPVSPDGKYIAGIDPIELEGMPVVDGQIWVIKKLAELGKILFKNNITHSYPHCWRCRNGLIFRATRQWFFNLNTQNVKQAALDSINKINFIPDRGRNFLKATVENRWEWCLSRQRIWGVPIPALLCRYCDYTFTDLKFINTVAQGVAKSGIEYWETVDLKELVHDKVCPKCNTADFKKEQDILDVWFDSGVSHFAVLYNNSELNFPADLYLEGVDQHRGWFQSSLITSLVLEGEACTKTIMTHGYTVDEKGRKMSKSLGNVVAPQDIMDKVGTDGLRLWVASIGYDSDPVVSQNLLTNISEVFRKVRNTQRFLLSNLYDFDITKDSLKPEELTLIDRYALVKLYEFQNKVLASYNECAFTSVFHDLADYCSSELSSFYLDIIKDRLYVESPDGKLRKSAQTAIWHILDVLTKLTAPIMSFNAEIVSDFYQKNKTNSIHLQSFSDLSFVKSVVEYEIGESIPVDAPFIETDKIIESKMEILKFDSIVRWQDSWEILKGIRSIILKSIEELRAKSVVGHSLDVSVELFIDLNLEEYKILHDLFKKLKENSSVNSIEHFFKELLVVSQFKYNNTSDSLPLLSNGVYAKVTHAVGGKCPRCWQWDASPGVDGLCTRCVSVLKF